MSISEKTMRDALERLYSRAFGNENVWNRSNPTDPARFDDLFLHGAIDELVILRAQHQELLGALEDCDNAFAAWQVGQIPGRPEDILRLIMKVRSAIAKAKGVES